MRWSCAILAAAVLSLFLAPNVDAAKAKKAAKKKTPAVTGTVVKVDKDSIEIETLVNKKKQPAAKPEKKTFKLNDQTKVLKITGKKKDKQETAATVSDLAKDSRVSLTVSDGTASVIKFSLAKPKKKVKKQS